MEENNLPRMTQPTPLFERLVTEEVQEMKAYARIIENQNRRLSELERVHGDLETRLELESRGRVQLETTLEERERQWALKFQDLEADRDRLKGVVKVEQTKNTRLRSQVVRKDQDIHRMLQRKVGFNTCFVHLLQSFLLIISFIQSQYDTQRESPVSHSFRNVNLRHTGNERQTGPTQPPIDLVQRGEHNFKSPHEILAASGSMERVRVKNGINLLMDFFAM
jgi:hypothetical protein